MNPFLSGTVAVVAAVAVAIEATHADNLDAALIETATKVQMETLKMHAARATAVYICNLADPQHYKIVQVLMGEAEVGERGNLIPPGYASVLVLEFAPIGDLGPHAAVNVIVYELRDGRVYSPSHSGLDLPDGHLDLPSLQLTTIDQLRAELNAQQAGAGQPATRPESELEGSDKPQPEAEGRSR